MTQTASTERDMFIGKSDLAKMHDAFMRKLREQAAALESQIATLKTTRCSLGREALFGLVDRDAVKKQRSAWRSQPSVVTWTQDMRRNRTSAESAETARKALRDELLAKLEATWAEVAHFSAVSSC
jgi:hypothetical protein